jgi:uncharacterized protein YuzE
LKLPGVLDILLKPEYLEPSIEGRSNAWIETSGKFLRVTYKEEQDRFLIITAVKKKKGWRRFGLKIEYDKEVDALYIQLREASIDDNIDIEEGVTVDLDEKKHIVGIEILDASKRLSLKDLVNITIENLPVEKVETVPI